MSKGAAGVEAWREDHRMKWRPKQWAKIPLYWGSARELIDLDRRYPKRHNVWGALVAICNGQTRRGWASYATLAVEARCTRKVAILAVRDLIGLGLLARRRRVRRQGNNAPNLWWLLPPPSLRSPQEEADLQAAIAAWSSAELIGGAAPAALADAAPDDRDDCDDDDRDGEPDEDAEGRESAPSGCDDGDAQAAPTSPPAESPAALVHLFHTTIHGAAEAALHAPTRRELQQAAELIGAHGWAACVWAVPAVAARLGTWRPEVLGGLLPQLRQALARRAELVAAGQPLPPAPARPGAAPSPEVEAAVYGSQDAADRLLISGLQAGGWLPRDYAGSRWAPEVQRAEMARDDAESAAARAQAETARAEAARVQAEAAAARRPSLHALLLDIEQELDAAAPAGWDRQPGMIPVDVFLANVLVSNARAGLAGGRRLLAESHADTGAQLAATLGEAEAALLGARRLVGQIEREVEKATEKGRQRQR